VTCSQQFSADPARVKPEKQMECIENPANKPEADDNVNPQ
jgi:hypothetical protein